MGPRLTCRCGIMTDSGGYMEVRLLSQQFWVCRGNGMADEFRLPKGDWTIEDGWGGRAELFRKSTGICKPQYFFCMFSLHFIVVCFHSESHTVYLSLRDLHVPFFSHHRITLKTRWVQLWRWHTSWDTILAWITTPRSAVAAAGWPWTGAVASWLPRRGELWLLCGMLAMKIDDEELRRMSEKWLHFRSEQLRWVFKQHLSGVDALFHPFIRLFHASLKASISLPALRKW